jgi:hypothetical protein
MDTETLLTHDLMPDGLPASTYLLILITPNLLPNLSVYVG